jgi:hypothetical protein
MIVKRKQEPHQYDTDRGERRRQEKALDEALKNTFPASDPISVQQPLLSAAAERKGLKEDDQARGPRLPDRPLQLT